MKGGEYYLYAAGDWQMGAKTIVENYGVNMDGQGP